MALDENDLKTITEMLNTTVNGSISNVKKLIEMQRKKDADELKLSFGTLLDEKLAGFTPPKDDDGKPGKKPKDGDDRELATLRREFEELKKTAATANQVAQAEREKNRNNAMKASVAEVLEPGGITGMRFKAAYALLRDRLRYADDASDDINFVEESGEVDYRAGLGSWLKTEEAKMFIPPTGGTGVNGAGTRPKSGNPQVKGGPVTRADQNARILGALGEWAENPR